MRSKRFIRNRHRRSKSDVMDVDITSLLDILVILLVFLIKSFNVSGIVFNIADGVKLPTSNSLTSSEPGIVVQISKDKIWVENKIVLDKTLKTGKRIIDRGGRRIIPLYNELVQQKRTIKLVEKKSKKATKFSGKVNLIVDKSIKYNYIRKILYTISEAGYQKYKFIVLGEES